MFLPCLRRILAFLEEQVNRTEEVRSGGTLQRLEAGERLAFGEVMKRTNCDHHELDTVQVFDFAARAKWLVDFAHGDIHVAAKRTLEKV